MPCTCIAVIDEKLAPLNGRIGVRFTAERSGTLLSTALLVVEKVSPRDPWRSEGAAPMPVIARRITYFGQPAVVCCDAQCSKAWGINRRPHVGLGDDPDDTAFLADHEVGEAPADPGTYEGGHAKPTEPDERLNKWCVRECERSAMTKAGQPDSLVEAPDLSRRFYNMPWLHRADA